MFGGCTEPPPEPEPPPLDIFLAPLIPAAAIDAILIPALIFAPAICFAANAVSNAVVVPPLNADLCAAAAVYPAIAL